MYYASRSGGDPYSHVMAGLAWPSHLRNAERVAPGFRLRPISRGRWPGQASPAMTGGGDRGRDTVRRSHCGLVLDAGIVLTHHRRMPSVTSRRQTYSPAPTSTATPSTLHASGHSPQIATPSTVA